MKNKMNKIIVSLTSYPARVNSVARTIHSILNQKLKADKIILWLSKDEFCNGTDKQKLSDVYKLVGIGGFEIRWVDGNIKPHKKYFYALQEYYNDVVITVDDDVEYAPTMIWSLVNSYRKHPVAISARRTRIINKVYSDTLNDYVLSDYDKWHNNHIIYDKERKDLLAIGVGGILYPPRCCDKDWFQDETIKNEAINQDDLWLKYCELSSNIPVVLVNDAPDKNIKEVQNTALFKRNVYDNSNVFKELMKLLELANSDIYKAFFESLMIYDELIIDLAEIYAGTVKNDISRYDYNEICICGAGNNAKLLFKFLKKIDLSELVSSFIVSSKNDNVDELFDKPIYTFKEMEKEKKYLFLCGVSEEYVEDIKSQISIFKYKNWYEFDWVNIQCIIE